NAIGVMRGPPRCCDAADARSSRPFLNARSRRQAKRSFIATRASRVYGPKTSLGSRSRQHSTEARAFTQYDLRPPDCRGAGDGGGGDSDGSGSSFTATGRPGSEIGGGGRCTASRSNKAASRRRKTRVGSEEGQ